jgi:hypothetical protein
MSRKALCLAVFALSGLLFPIAASASPSAATLRSIGATAMHVASQKDLDRKTLRGPAREIALEWAKTEPALASDGSAIVETQMLNRAITSFENDWARDVGKAPADARHVALAARNLLDATE